jgi:hypothetical protein
MTVFKSFTRLILAITVASLLTQTARIPTSYALTNVSGDKATVTQLLESSDCFRTATGALTCNSGTATAPIEVGQGSILGKTITDFEGASGGTYCAVVSDGTAHCWGNNNYAAIGDNTVTRRESSVAVFSTGALSGVTLRKISTRDWGTCAISSTSKLYCWGWQGGSKNNLKNGSSSEYVLPTLVSDAALNSHSWKDVQVSGSNTGGGVCGLTTSNQIRCWKLDIWSNATAVYSIAIPSLASGESLESIESVYANSTGCTTSNLGDVYCWGFASQYPQLTGISTTNAVRVPFSTTAVDILVTYGNVCAVLSTGSVECMGDRDYDYVALGVIGNPIVRIRGTGPNGILISKMESNRFLSRDGLLWTAPNMSDVNNPATIGVEVTPKTPTIAIDSLELVSYFQENNCSGRTSTFSACISMNVRSSASSRYSVDVFANASGSSLVTTASDLSQMDATLLVDGRNTYWIRVSATGFYGTTTSPLLMVNRIYTTPSIQISSYGTSSGVGYLNLYANYNSDDGGMNEEIDIQFQRSGTSSWSNISTATTRNIKTSTSYNIRSTIRTPMGTATDSKLVSTPNMMRKVRIYRNSRVLISTVFRIDSPGKRTWSRFSGCRISGKYLFTGSSSTCRLTLKIAGAKGYVASTWTYTTGLS